MTLYVSIDSSDEIETCIFFTSIKHTLSLNFIKQNYPFYYYTFWVLSVWKYRKLKNVVHFLLTKSLARDI